MTELYLTICKHSVDRRLLACRLCDAEAGCAESDVEAAAEVARLVAQVLALLEGLDHAYAIIGEGGWRERYYGDPDHWWAWDQFCDRLGLERQATDVERSQAPRLDADLRAEALVLSDISGQAQP